jgi:Enoyl-CoA hydratase/isomerase
VTLTLAGPQRLNALSAGLNLQLQDRLDEIARDPTFRSVVITGEDFSAGGDLRMMLDGNRAVRDSNSAADTADPWSWIRRQFGGVVRTTASTDKRFAAALKGPAAGVGLAFVLACDVIIASERSCAKGTSSPPTLSGSASYKTCTPTTSCSPERTLGVIAPLDSRSRPGDDEVTAPASSRRALGGSLRLEEFAEAKRFSTEALGTAAASS